MVFEEQDVVSSHNTSSQIVQQKVCKNLLFNSAYTLFTGISMVSGKLQRGTSHT